MNPSKMGPYPIEREVGRGGMGVVYLGRDTKLDRPVAIKVLPDGFAQDPDRLARFEREARLLAALTHPNIAGIYGLEEDEGRRFLVLEYVEGSTLAEVLQRAPLPLAETIDVCRQIAGALEAAHEAGIVHRDLKPGNVKITPDDKVKVLDFGLAKGTASDSESSSGLSHSPTLTRGATVAGVVMGTAAYMSPEQARGKNVDRRTDIWSFGCLLYECLTGTQAFEGETATDIMASILKGEPEWSKLPPGLPPKLRELLERCLVKDAKARLRDMGDARLELEEIQGLRTSSASRAAASSGELPAAVDPRPRGFSVPLGAALLASGALLGALAWGFFGIRHAEVPAMRFSIQSPPRVDILSDSNEQAISPDGLLLAFLASDSSGQRSLWVRPLASFTARALPNTKGADLPFWSPDSKQLGFFADGKLKKLVVDGGSPEPLCDAASGRGASWSTKGVIVFCPSPAGPLFQVRASGGAPEQVTVVDTSHGENAHRWPCFLPDGEHFTYAALPARQGQFACYVGSASSRERRPILTAEGAPVYAAPGYLIFHRNSALQAQSFDAGSRQLKGDPFTIGDPPGSTQFSAGPGASVSATGVLSWMTAGNPNTRFAWLDRAGRELKGLNLPLDQWAVATISHDGKRAAAEQHSPSGNTDLWVVDLEREIANRITFEQGVNTGACWSPDDRELFFSSNRSGVRDLYRRASDGSGADRLLYHSAVPFKDVYDCSPDGKWIVFGEIGDASGWNLMQLPVSGGVAAPLLSTPFNEQSCQISPDGRWIVYTSDESGSLQAYIQSFPGSGNRQQVSKTGAFFATWAQGGREILILRPDFGVVSVPVEPGTPLHLGAPLLLYQMPSNFTGWIPEPDGQRFLAEIPVEKTTTGISIAVNWLAGRGK